MFSIIWATRAHLDGGSIKTFDLPVVIGAFEQSNQMVKWWETR